MEAAAGVEAEARVIGAAVLGMGGADRADHVGTRDGGVDRGQVKREELSVRALRRPVRAGVELLVAVGGQRLDGADVLLQDGKVVAVGTGLQAPAGATRVDGTGKWVTPGLIDVQDSRPVPGIEWELAVDRAEAAKYGLDVTTVGSVIPTRSAVIPAAVGVDIGCGMMAVRTSVRAEHLPDSLRALRLAIEAGVPHGVFQYLHANHDIAQRLIRAPEIGYVSFTGSVRGGRSVEQAAAGRFIGVGLELGGNDPAYVRADANLAHAVETLVDGAFFNSGQSCCGIERIYVHSSVYDAFVEGAVANGVPGHKAEQIFEQVDKFAGYGFNKSHAAAYALVAYQTAWMKANYPVEFLAASMTFELGNTDKLNVFRQELDRMAIKLLPPDINKSRSEFAVEALGNSTGPHPEVRAKRASKDANRRTLCGTCVSGGSQAHFLTPRRKARPGRPRRRPSATSRTARSRDARRSRADSARRKRRR